MKIVNIAFFAFTFALVTAGCNKDDKDPDPGEKPQKYQLRSINYTPYNGLASYTYNTDSTLKQIAFSAGNTGYTVSFEYDNRNVSRILVANSLYEHRYNYLNGRISSTITTQIGQPQLGNKFVYSYNSNGKASQLQYFDLNEAGEQLVYNSTYEYNSAGLPSKIVSVNGNTKVIWTIESYSEVCDFNEWSFIGINLNELYELHNYPVLSGMNRLPTRIVQSVQIGSATPQVQKIIEREFTINNQRLDKIIGSVIFPYDPTLNTSSESVFNYD